MLGVLSSIRAPPKSARFVTLRGDATKILENRLNRSANPSPLSRLGAAQKFCSCSAHGPLMVGGMGRTALYLKVSPAGFGLRPDHVRWPDLHADATQPATGHLDLSVLSLPFLLIPISSRDVNLTSFARLSCIFDSFAVSVAVLPSVLFSFRDFSPPPIPSRSAIVSPLFRIASMHDIICIIRDDAGNAGGVVQ